MAGSQRSRGWAVLRFLAGVLIGAVALWALNGDRGELVGASVVLSRVRPGWLVVGIALEVCSIASYGFLQQRLLRAARIRVGLRWATAVSFAALTIASSVPAGPAFSTVYSFRQYRRRGADEAAASWALLATFVFAALGLCLLATAGVLLATSESASYDLVGVVLVLFAITAGVDAVVWQRSWLARFAVFVLSGMRRLVHRPRREAVVVVTEMLERLAEVRLGWRDLALSVLAGLSNWVFDCGCLACAFLAVGAPVPWRGLLLAYGAGQLAQNLPITPGGLGVVEGSLTIALVAFGGAEVTSVAAVLLYRIVTFWGYLPLGWADWALLTVVNRRADRRAEPVPPAEVVAKRLAGEESGLLERPGRPVVEGGG